jgi:hypothetical protein
MVPLYSDKFTLIMVGAPLGEVAPAAHPVGPMRACEWAVLVSFEHLGALLKAEGGLMAAPCVLKVTGGGGAWHLGQALQAVVWVLLALLGVTWTPKDHVGGGCSSYTRHAFAVHCLFWVCYECFLQTRSFPDEKE